jgi:hypothetical protein
VVLEVPVEYQREGTGRNLGWEEVPAKLLEEEI